MERSKKIVWAGRIVSGLASMAFVMSGLMKLKGGVEATYLFLSWMGVSERFDHVRLHGNDSTQAYTSASSRLLFHTGWKSLTASPIG